MMIKKTQKNGRIVAVEALIKQEQNGYSNLVLDSVLKKSKLEPREKSFASAVFYGVLERIFTLDWMLQQCIKQPLSKLDAPVRAILRAGLYQAVYMEGVPVRAAVNESVQLVRVFRKASASGFVNAVLRKAIKQNPQEASFNSESERISVVYSVSQPIADHFLKYYSQDAERILQAFFEKPPLAIRVNTLKTTESELCQLLQQEGWESSKTDIPNSLVVQGKGSIAQTKAFTEGLFHVQGLGSQLACLYLSPKAESKTLDLCAAPGGKSATLAQYMQNQGELFCGDAVVSRVSLISQTLNRLGITIGTAKHQDASVFQEDLQNADFILCDVPCSGLGIMAKKPDIRSKMLEKIDELYPIQQKILETAACYLKKGGRIVYSTCTLNPKENEEQVRLFLKTHTEFQLVLPQYIPKGAVLNDNMITLRPDYNLYDGFFIATLERL